MAVYIKYSLAHVGTVAEVSDAAHGPFVTTENSSFTVESSCSWGIYVC